MLYEAAKMAGLGNNKGLFIFEHLNQEAHQFYAHLAHDLYVEERKSAESKKQPVSELSSAEICEYASKGFKEAEHRGEDNVLQTFAKVIQVFIRGAYNYLSDDLDFDEDVAKRHKEEWFAKAMATKRE